jgi:hypothetical protein
LHPTVTTLVRRLVDDLPGVLGGDLVGLYLYGSAVSGGFDPGVSDIDLLAVTGTDADQLDLDRLDLMHRSIVASSPEWADRIEIVYIGRVALGSFRTSAGSLAVISPGEPLHVTGPVSDWFQNWFLVRDTGIALFGPPAEHVIPPIDRGEFLAAVARYAGWVGTRTQIDVSSGALAYDVLSMCRALRTVRTGVQCSKEEGAAWTRQRMPDWAWLIDAALRCRLSRGTTGFDDEQTRTAAKRLIRLLAAEVQDSAPADRPPAPDADREADP